LALAIFASYEASDTAAQRQSNQPVSLLDMVATERAFAGRAQAVGWKQAFLEYFADDAIGFDSDQSGRAKDQIRSAPDPPKELQLLWEPRYGDIAASGDLGYLTGPSTSINPARNNGMPRHSNYASVWKRQGDGSFKVVMDVGIPTPGPVTFPQGFTRAARDGAFKAPNGPAADTASLRKADGEITNDALKSQVDAYRGRLAPGARLHRGAIMPLLGDDAIVAWLRSQPAYTEGDVRYAEAARSGDLGYTWGHYALPAEKGFYVRAWSRDGDGAWKVALDVLQPQ
jgi:ketosteroid isomerase-like protein